ncbi:MAG: hypothetical protein GXO47_10555 [Chlorobi bacterium]|nr:hypothetical protein [Chlorobiota bacterium]
MLKRILSIFLIFYLTIPVLSQVNKFPEDPDAFLEQIEERFIAAAGKKQGKEFSENIALFWNDPSTSQEIKKLIIETCNLMAVKRARPYPDYEVYLKTVIAFYKSEQRDKNFNIWHSYISDLLKARRVPLRNAIKQMRLTRGLIENNEIYSTPSVKWIYNTNDITFRYDNNNFSIEFGKNNIVCRSKNDSIVIYDTQGILFPEKQLWKGNKGRITWQRSGFPADKVYATFNEYELAMNKAYFTIDSVEFYNKYYFNYPLKGKLKHKVMVIHKPSSSIYPQFTSYEQRFQIKRIHPNIDYEGGFSQNGAKFLGSGTSKNPATITIYRNDTVFITAKSMFFSLLKDRITSNDTEIYIRLDSAFIYHPGLLFKYMAETNEIFLIRNGEGIAQSPYFNTYHNISMDVELIRWKMGEPWMDLRMIKGSAENLAFFESLSYFREEFYNRLQGMDAIHPLQGLKNCAKFYDGAPFTAKEYAQFLGLPEHQIRQQIMNLSFFGFIGYNVNTDVIEIRQHLYDYLLFRLGKKDYDVIRFNSSTPANVPNAQLDLKNYDLKLNGVSSISICDHQNVVFFPKFKKIVLKQNRNFNFDGVINAGMLNLYGDGFRFSYEDFKIEMKNIDSLRMKVETGELDYFGQPVLETVHNPISNLSGNLLIDEPDNKSGRKNNAQYPILQSTKESFVHFNNVKIGNESYDPEKFYFTLEPFEMDSINTLKKQNFNFDGTFVSNIFPDFKEKLTIRHDFSLGFRRKTPPEGYPVYGGKAVFTNTIDMSDKGLRGNGILSYLNSTSSSDDFLFLHDEVTGLANDFTVEKQTEGVTYPDVQAKYVQINYFPFRDELNAATREEFFTLYNKESQLNGKLKITPDGLTGSGLLYMLRASLKAPRISFGDHSIFADSSSFKLVGETEEAVSFSTSNLISSNVDFQTREGVFTSMGAGEPVNFEDNKYMSIITKFSWNMDLNKIYMGARGSKGNLFISTHKKQDSLQFYVPIAEYDMDKKLIVAEEVKNIKVADANIFLKNGIVTIRENAAMDPLDSTTIELGDTATFTHTIYDSHVTIAGRYEYSGYGSYDFVNGDNKVFKISFHEISADKKNRVTTAKGVINDYTMFTFNSHFAYKGKVDFRADRKFLLFDGGVQMLHKCSNKGPKSYLKFSSVIDPNNVKIPVDEEPINLNRDKIYHNFFLTKDSVHIYSSFLEGRSYYSDIPIIDANGFLVYNDDNSSFEIAQLSKIQHPDSVGSILRFAENECSIIGEGLLNLGVDLGQVKVTASGTITDDRNKNEISLSAMMGIDFFLDPKTVELFYTSIVNSSAKTSNFNDKIFRRRASELIGPKQADKAVSKRSMLGEVESLPEEIANTLMFSNIQLEWNKTKKCYQADCDADLSFIKNFSLNQKVKVKTEITPRRNGSIFEMYLEADKETWFFFSYKNGVMYILSSIPEFNSNIRESKPDDRKIRAGFGTKSYIYMISPESKLKKFMKEFGVKKEVERAENPLDRDKL